MSNENNTALSIKKYLESPAVKDKFTELLGKKAQNFVTSVLHVIASNDLLSKADPISVYQSAATAAVLDLPLNQNLGFAYIVPYNDRKANKCVAQFQMGYKGFIQLAQRTGLFARINCTDVREGEIKHYDRLSGDIQFEWIQKQSDRNEQPIIAYVAYFRLHNGFEKTNLMFMDEIKAHASRYSQSFKKGYGLWSDDFDKMALKTVVKQLLSKDAPLSIEMQQAIVFDQSVIKNMETQDVEYTDATDDILIVDIEDLTMLYEMKKEAMTQEQQINAERIINNKEIPNYNKLAETLKAL